MKFNLSRIKKSLRLHRLKSRGLFGTFGCSRNNHTLKGVVFVKFLDINKLVLFGFLIFTFFTISFFTPLVFAGVVEVESQPDNIIINIEGQIELPVCSIIDSNNDGIYEAYWVKSESTKTNALTNCDETGVNSQGTQLTSCCPTEFQCNLQTHSCQKIVIQEVSCSDLDYDKCLSATPPMIKKSIYARIAEAYDVSVSNLNDFCTGNSVYQLSNANSCSLLIGPCRCKWTGSQSSGKCVDKIISTSCSDPDKEQLSCETRKTGLVDKCDSDGIYVLTWIGLLYNPDGTISNQKVSWCQSGSKTFNCPSENIVPFFNLWNLLFATGMIVIAYLIIVNSMAKK